MIFADQRGSRADFLFKLHLHCREEESREAEDDVPARRERVNAPQLVKESA